MKLKQFIAVSKNSALRCIIILLFLFLLFILSCPVTTSPKEDSDLKSSSSTASSESSSSSSASNYWVQEAYIKAVNNGGDDEFGDSVAIYGDTIVAGAEYESSNQTTITNGTTASNDDSISASGAVYVYKRTGTTWAQEAYIKAVNNGESDCFGSQVAISDDTIVIASYNEDSSQTTITNGTDATSDNSSNSSGAVYVYKRTGTTWAQEAYIKAVNNDAEDDFGISIAVSGDTIAVGARYEDSNETTITNGTTASPDDTNSASGAVYVYKRTGTAWAQEAYIKAVNNNADDQLRTVAISGDTIVVGAAYEDSNQTTITNGVTASPDDSSSNSGAVYVYKRTGSTWAQEAYIKAVNNDTDDLFGLFLSISGDTIVIGAMNEDSNETTITNGVTASPDDSSSNSGAVYVYKRTGTTWAQETYIKAVNNDAGDTFGSSVSISGDIIAVGARYEDSNETTITNGTTASTNDSAENSGAVYVYKRTGTTWAQEAYIKAVNNDAGDYFGDSVAVYGDTISVGAYPEASSQTTITNGTTASSDNSSGVSGAVYVYKRQ